MAAPSAGGAFQPKGYYDLGATSGAQGVRDNGLYNSPTLVTPTLTTPTITSPTITGTTSIGTGATLTGPSIVAPSGSGSTGMLITKTCLLTENGAATSYTATIPIPAGATIQSITVIAQALWNGTSATGKVGDTASDNGYFTGINLKATDLLVGEILSVRESTLWGGKEGAYLVAATGRRGPTSSNFGLYYAAGSNITMIVTPGAADGSAGRTLFQVTYSVGEVLAQVAV